MQNAENENAETTTATNCSTDKSKPGSALTKSSADISTALAKAQIEFGGVSKDANNPHFKKAYATLQSVHNAVQPALNKHGIAITGYFNAATRSVVTRLVKGDEFLEVAMPLLGNPANMQQLGSAITYARRYSLLLLCGVAPMDETEDDGNQASLPDKPKAKKLSDGELWAADIVKRIEAITTKDQFDRAKSWVLEKGYDQMPEVYEAVNQKEMVLIQQTFDQRPAEGEPL